MRSGNIAIVLAFAVFTANVQCVATCESLFWSATNKPTKAPKPEPQPSCHHTAPASDGEDEPASDTCSHQTFVSEVGPKSVPSVQNMVAFEIVQDLVVHLGPQVLGNFKLDFVRPPPPFSVSTITVLRV